MADRDDSARTEDSELVDQLREQGILGPFVVSDWAGLTDTGRVRSHNEDRWLGDPDLGFVVADGMGGHAGGDVAADVAARCAFGWLGRLTEVTAPEMVYEANAAVLRAGADIGAPRLGSTLVALANRRNHVVVVGVGDSRVYRWRDGDAEQLTIDHSVRNELAAAGVAVEAAQEANVRLDALTAFIGQRSQFPPPLRAASFSVMAGDRFLLCSDGISGALDGTELARLMAAPTCHEAARGLIDAAAAAGGRDNATAVIAEFTVDPGAER